MHNKGNIFALTNLPFDFLTFSIIVIMYLLLFILFMNIIINFLSPQTYNIIIVFNPQY